MVVANNNQFSTELCSEEKDIISILISVICLYGDEGLPLERINDEFMLFSGFPIPYEKFGCDNLRSYLSTLPEIYIVLDSNNNEIVIQHSKKCSHIKQFINKQKPPRTQTKRKFTNYDFEYPKTIKRQKKFEKNCVSESSFIHASINTTSINNSERFDKFEQLESMLPLFYKHQALGDDFFLDIADTKMGYYVPDNGLKECGLCTSEQTISKLTEKVKLAKNLAPRVVVMIGFQDLMWGHSINTMISDLRQLIVELKKRNTRVTLVTLVPTPKLPKTNKRLLMRMDMFNKAILDYACDSELKCNVIDMNSIFQLEATTFRQHFDRFTKIAKSDPYKVLSDYGKKIFMNTLKTCLKEQIKTGH